MTHGAHQAPAVDPFVVRTVDARDQSAWCVMRERLWPTCSPERHRLEIGELLSGDGLVALAIALNKNEPIGFLEVSIRLDHVEGTTQVPVPYVEGWYVEPAWRGIGAGRALMRFAETWARDRGFVEIASDAELDNDEAIRAHAAVGFHEVGRSVHFVRRLH